MLAAAAKLALVATALALVVVTGADAQGHHPRCAKVKDKVNCTCIFANGGQIYRPPGGRARPTFATIGEYDAYARCMRSQGRFR